MTEDEADYQLLSLANEKGKFAIAMDCVPAKHQQDAFERGIDNEWFRFVDISHIACEPLAGPFKIFKLTFAGLKRLEILKPKHGRKT